MRSSKRGVHKDPFLVAAHDSDKSIIIHSLHDAAQCCHIDVLVARSQMMVFVAVCTTTSLMMQQESEDSMVIYSLFDVKDSDRQPLMIHFLFGAPVLLHGLVIVPSQTMQGSAHDAMPTPWLCLYIYRDDQCPPAQKLARNCGPGIKGPRNTPDADCAALAALEWQCGP